VLDRNDLALLDLSEAVSLAPGDSFAYASRGQVNRQNGHYAEALADFDRAIQIDPNYSWAIERRRETVAEMAPPPAAGTGPAVSPAAVGPLPLVAVLDFRIESLPPADGQLIVDLLTSALVKTRRYRVLERSQRESLLKEIEFSHSDMADERRQLEIGRMLSADQIVVGSLGRVGQRFVINAKLLDVRTGEALGSAYKVHKSLEEVVDACGELAASLGQ
jgi:tetratricopeptide (TPR) repeat protein